MKRSRTSSRSAAGYLRRIASKASRRPRLERAHPFCSLSSGESLRTSFRWTSAAAAEVSLGNGRGSIACLERSDEALVKNSPTQGVVAIPSRGIKGGTRGIARQMALLQRLPGRGERTGHCVGLYRESRHTALFWAMHPAGAASHFRNGKHSWGGAISRQNRSPAAFRPRRSLQRMALHLRIASLD